LFNPVFFVEKIFDFIRKFAGGKENIHSKYISVYLIAVDSHIQNKGMGKRLLQFLENDLKKNKIFEYTLAVRKDNKNAIEFYKKNNFSEVESDYKSISFIKYLRYD
jgi:ribosomal protein S18 acetylase RimI-like enzyme